MLSCVQLFVTLWTVAHQAPLHGDSLGKNTGVDCQALLQGIFPTQGLNLRLLCLLGCRQILYPLSHQGSQRPQTDLGLVISVEQGTSASLHHPQSVGLYPQIFLLKGEKWQLQESSPQPRASKDLKGRGPSVGPLKSKGTFPRRTPT